MRFMKSALSILILVCTIVFVLDAKEGVSESVHPFKIRTQSSNLPDEPKIGILIRTFEGYYGKVFSVDFSPDGLLIASSGSDKAIHLWSSESGQLTYSFTGFPDHVKKVIFSPDGKLLASQCYANSINIWSVEKKELVRTFKGSDLTGFTPDGKGIVFIQDRVGTGLWSVETGALKGSVRKFYPRSISPDGKTMSATNMSTTAYLVSLTTGRVLRTFEGHSKPVNHVAFSPDSSIIVTTSSLQENIINFWSAKTGKLLNTIKGVKKIEFTSLDFTPDSKTIAVGCSDGKIRLWEIKSGKFIGLIEGHSKGVSALHFSPDGRFLLSGSGDATLKYWSVESLT